MTTFTETKVLQSLEIFPALNVINTRYKVTTLKDGVKFNEQVEAKSYSTSQFSDFEMEVAPTGGTLAEIVAGFSEAALTAASELPATLAAKQAELDTALATAQAAHAAELAAVQAALAAKDEEIARLTALIPAPVIVDGVPQTVTMRQARLALLSAGLLDLVTEAVAGAGQAAQIEWEYASDVGRNATLIQSLAGVMGLTDEQLDGLFVLAATL